MNRALKSVGTTIKKPDAGDKVTGRAKYAGDLVRDGMLYAKAVRSPYAHARVVSIDIKPALDIRGVYAALTAEDIPGVNKISMTGTKDQPVLVEDRVRFYGEAVAVVAAESQEIAEEAVRAIKVEYEPLPVINSPEEAAAEGAVLLHDKPNNLCVTKRVEKGNVEKALAEADVVVTRVYKTQMVEHAYLEPEAALAEPWEDGLKVWSTTKSVHLDRTEICRVLNMSPEKVRVVAPYIGGSFGGKSDIPINVMVAMLCLKTGRPVRMTYTREESIHVSTKRHPMIMKYTHGAKKDGTLVAVKCDIIADSGGYSVYSAAVMTRSVIHGGGPYRVPNYLAEANSYFTNHPNTGAMRAFGVPQVCFAHERQMDILAKELGLDPFEIRMKNALRPGDEISTGQVLPEGIGYVEALLEAKKRIEKDIKENPLAPNEAWGVAGHYYGNGRTAAANPGTATVKLCPDGKVFVTVGSPDIGQGSDTVLLQVAADALEVAPEYIKFLSADTHQTLDSGTTSGTRLTAIVGRGVQDTVFLFREKLLEKCAKELGINAGKLVLKEERGQLLVAGEGKLLYLRELAQRCAAAGENFEVSGRYDPPTTSLDAEKGQGIPYPSFTFGVQCARAKVSTGTGKVDIQRFIDCYDVGQPVNPQLLEGQLEGGTVNGLGYALIEEIQLKDGRVTTENFDTYLLPTTLDVCPIETYFVPTKDPEGPFGAKGIGEPAIIPTAPAVANAVSAVLGHEFNSLPLNLERVLLEPETK